MRFRLAMAVACPHISKPRLVESSTRLELLLEQIKAVEAERDALLDADKPKRRPRRRCCWVSMASGRSSLRSFGLRDFLPDTSITADRSPLMPALPRRLWQKRVGPSRAGHLAIGQLRDSGQFR